MGEMGEIKMQKIQIQIQIQTHLSILADFSLGLERVVPLALLSPPKQISTNDEKLGPHESDICQKHSSPFP